MKWLKEYQNHEVCLVGDDELTKGRSWNLQMLYEFNILSISLPDINNANLMPTYISESSSSSVSFEVPLCPKDKRLKGLNISFKYTTSNVENRVWFVKISTANGVDLMYNPRVFGKPAFGQVAIWLSYWPIGNTLKFGDKVSVSIVVMKGLEIRECGANLVYTDDEVASEIMQNEMELVNILGGGLSRFQLTTGAYYLCRRDFFELMEADKGTLSRFRILVGDIIDHTELRGWRKTGRPQQSDQSFTEMKTIRCVFHGPESEQFYKIAEMSKPSLFNKTGDFTLSIYETLMKSVSSERGLQTGKNNQSQGEEDFKVSCSNRNESVRLFVSQVPKHMTEAQLLDIFKEFALVDDVNIIKDDATHASRGYCLVICPSREETDKFVDAFHDKTTLHGASSPLQVTYADGELKQLDHKLFIGMLPQNVSEGEVSALLSQFGTLEDLQILRGFQQFSYAFVNYERKEQAVAAITSLNGKHKMKGSTVPVVVKWADTEQEKQTRMAQEAKLLANVDSTRPPSLFGTILNSIPLDNLILQPNKTLTRSIEEWKDRNTMITIASMIPKLSKPMGENEEEVICCLEELQKLCEERALHREWIVAENYIPTLVELLGSTIQGIRTRTLVLLNILTKDSDDAKERIANINGVLEPIVQSLGRQISEGVLAVKLLMELSRNERLKNCMGMVQGCILLLVTMTNSCDTQAAMWAHELLDQLSFSDQNVIQMAKANYFGHLLHRLSSGSEEAKMCMVTTLAEMELTDHIKSSLSENGALDSLLHLISLGNPRMKETAAKALRNLSSLSKNSIQMIKNGSVNSLVDLLYNHTSSDCFRNELAAIIMHLAMSTISGNYNEPPVSLFESDGDIDSLFSFIGCSRPLVQECLLQSFYAMCQSPLAVTVKTKLRQNPENIQLLVILCENENQKVRANAVRLFCCLSEDRDDKEIIDHVGLQSIEILTKIIISSSDVDEIASAMGVISNMSLSSQLTESLLKAKVLPIIFSYLYDIMQNRAHQQQLVENIVGSLCHFTIPTNQTSQKEVAEAGVIPLLVQLLEVGTTLTKRKASISLGQLSKNSPELTHKPRPLGGMFRCFSSHSESACPVHQGICTVETSFCLVEADAVSPLVILLGDSDLNVCEASLDALLTLIEAERLPYGSKVLAEANAIHPIIKLLNCPSSSLQEKISIALERMFSLLDFKKKYGNLLRCR